MWPLTTKPAPPPEVAPPGITAAPGPPPTGGMLSWLRGVLPFWPGPKAAAAMPALRERLEGEDLRVSSGPATLALPWFLPYIDDYTNEPAAARAAYRGMLADPNVKAALLNKLLAVKALRLKVVPAGGGRRAADREAAEFVRWNLAERLADGVPGLIHSVLMHGLVDGYSICEKVFGFQESGRWREKYVLARLKPKDVDNDLVLRTDQFRNVVDVMGLRYNAGKTFSPARFLIFRHMPLYDSPVGMSDFRAVYSRYWILDTVLKLRAINAEKRAVPLLMGTYASTSQKATLEQAMSNAKALSWFSLPESVKVEALSIAGSADDVFKGFCQDCSEDIFIGIAGASLQTLQGVVSDGRGNSKVHAETASLRVLDLAAAVCALLNDREGGLVRDLVDLNFNNDEYPTVSLSAPDTQTMLDELDIDERLAGLGLELSRKKLYEDYGRTPPDPGEPGDALGAAPPPAVDDVGGMDGGGDFQAFRESRARRRRPWRVR